MQPLSLKSPATQKGNFFPSLSDGSFDHCARKHVSTINFELTIWFLIAFKILKWLAISFFWLRDGHRIHLFLWSRELSGACGAKTNAAMPGPMGRKRKAGILACGWIPGERGIICWLWLEPGALLFDYFFLGVQEKVNNGDGPATGKRISISTGKCYLVPFVRG